jgi:uncharacterized protein (DUF58 family)
MLQQFLDPSVLASISSLDLIAKTVVDGFVAGLHRSPKFGFSQEFAEYQQYVQGDDLRHIDWNVFARSERLYLKRFKGETNMQLLILLDASASMTYGSGKIRKLDYARYVAASLAYLSSQQRDATGLIIFDQDVSNYIPPSTRQGQLMRILHAIEKANGGARTDFSKPFIHFQQFLKRRGIVVVISDFYEKPEQIVKVVEPLRYRGNEVVLFHVLDPNELAPKFRDPVLLQDVEDDSAMEVSPDYARNEYKVKIDEHMRVLSEKARAAGLDYCFMNTAKPLDEGLRNFLALRQRRM